MRKFICLFLVLLAPALWAADVPSAQTPLLLTGNGAGGTISSSNPLPMVLASTAVSIPTSPAFPGTATTTTVVSTSTSASILALSNRFSIAFFNIGTTTVWLDIGSGTATVGSGIPVYSGAYVAIDADDGVAAAHIASVPTSLTIFQEGL